jgi:hypothetical protein
LVYDSFVRKLFGNRSADGDERATAEDAGDTPTAPEQGRGGWRRRLFGRPAATVFFGAAEVGPGRNGTAEQWAQYREELLNPPPRRPSEPPPGYKFVWYTDGMGMRHRAAVRIDRDTE